MIKIENLSYSYFGKIPALSGVDLSIQQGDMVAVIGSNGSGKSTLLQIIAGLLFGQTGNYCFMDKSITGKALKDIAFVRFFRERVGFVFQNSDIQLFCPSVIDELMFGPMQLGLGPDEALGRSEEIMDLLGISGLRDRPCHMLSGGEKKRVAIGSVLTMNPAVILLDEPTAGLDPKTESFLIELIIGLNEAGKTIVMATHDLSLAEDLEPSIAVLSEDHRLVKTGSADEIFSDTELLVGVNLIHEHLHRHGAVKHRHLRPGHFLHRHNGK